MEVRPLQVLHENEAHCLCWIHVSVLVSRITSKYMSYNCMRWIDVLM